MDNPIQKFFDSCSNHVEAVPVHESFPNVILIRWSRTGIGFGELTLKVTEEGLFIDSECSSAETVKAILNDLVDDTYNNERTDNHKREERE